MKKQKYALLRFFVILGVVSLACGIKINMNGDPTVSPPSTQIQQPVAPLPTIRSQPTISIHPQATIAIPPMPNSEVQPTVGPQPTVEPQPSNSEAPADFQQLVERYYNKAYLPSTKGEYHLLDDFSKDWAAINDYDLWETGYYPENFMVTANFEWQSAIRYPDPSGCGFGFHRQGDDHYLFFVDRETVWIGTWDDSSRRFTRIGPSNGDNWVGLGNPGKADVALIVNQKKAYAVVNNDFRGSYTLDTDWLLGSGELDYTVVSGTNKDYGTRCTMTKVQLWIFEP